MCHSQAGVGSSLSTKVTRSAEQSGPRWNLDNDTPEGGALSTDSSKQNKQSCLHINHRTVEALRMDKRDEIAEIFKAGIVILHGSVPTSHYSGSKWSIDTTSYRALCLEQMKTTIVRKFCRIV